MLPIIVAQTIAILLQQPAIQVDLVSRENCKSVVGGLVECNFKKQALSLFPLPESAVPFRTIVRTRMSGDCSTPDAIWVELRSAAQKWLVPAVGNRELSISLKSRAHIRELLLDNASPRNSAASFEEDCHSWLEVEPNRPDIASAEEARNILLSLATRLHETHDSLKTLQNYADYQTAFILLQRIASHPEDGWDDLLRDRSKLQSALAKLSRLKLAGLDNGEQVLLGKLQDLLDMEGGTRNPVRLSEEETRVMASLAKKTIVLEKNSQRFQKLSIERLNLCRNFRVSAKLLTNWISEIEQQEILGTESCDER